MDATKIFFNRNRNRLVSESVNESKSKCEEIEIPVESGLEERESYLGNGR